MSEQNRFVLIVEDNATDVSVLQVLLKRMGVSYSVFFDGRTILAMLREMPRPDAIFLDLEIPGMSGYEVLAVLQSVPDFRSVPVVAYTSHLSEMTAARDAGFHSFLGKPLNNAKFSELLERIFEGESVWEGRTFLSNE